MIVFKKLQCIKKWVKLSFNLSTLELQCEIIIISNTLEHLHLSPENDEVSVLWIPHFVCSERKCYTQDMKMEMHNITHYTWESIKSFCYWLSQKVVNLWLLRTLHFNEENMSIIYLKYIWEYEAYNFTVYYLKERINNSPFIMSVNENWFWQERSSFLVFKGCFCMHILSAAHMIHVIRPCHIIKHVY